MSAPTFVKFLHGSTILWYNVDKVASAAFRTDGSLRLTVIDDGEECEYYVDKGIASSVIEVLNANSVIEGKD